MAAKKEYLRVGKILESARVLTAADRATLEQYAVSYADWVACREQIEAGGIVVDSGRNGDILSPWFRAAEVARVALAKAAAELGLTPAARARVQAVPEGKGGDDLEERLLG